MYMGHNDYDQLTQLGILRRLRRITVEQSGLLEHARELVDQAYECLDRNDLRVIYCDLWHGNIRMHRGELYPFDFEDTILGFRLHDIAMAMLDLLDEVGRERYRVLLAAFRNGYERLLPWPEGDMEALQAGRILWIINWVARFSATDLGRAVVRHEPALRRFCSTGRLLPSD
jgi:Ser/Thr protein kinase RdoA (MazF antagonist)